MDRNALEHDLAWRLLHHIDHETTDHADGVFEVPTEKYTSPERFNEEIEVLFLGRPMLLGLSGVLPGPGSYRALEICKTPVLLTRDEHGQVHSFANICRHRGVRIVEGAGQTKRLICPFHAWTYDTAGHLVGVPTPSGFEGLCTEDKGLIELPVDERHGLIVGRLRPGPAVDVDEYLGAELAKEIEQLGLENWEVFTEPHMHVVGGSWKVTLDTFRENYHFDFLHRRTLAGTNFGGTLTFDPFGFHLRNSSAAQSIVELRDRPEDEWEDVIRHITIQYALFPNTSLSVTKHVDLFQIFPVDSASCQVLHTQFVPPDVDETERKRIVEFTQWVCTTVVDGEDFWVAGQTEPGLHTGMLDNMVFGRNEPVLQHLHRGYDRALAEARATRKVDA